LETGRDVARLMGGKDRSDGVGQVSLGVWFAYKLKGGSIGKSWLMIEYHRLEGNAEEHARCKPSLTAHTGRIREIKALGERFAKTVSGHDPAGPSPIIQQLGFGGV
jgi:hypothetical protein